MKEITKEEINALILERGLTLTAMIDQVIELNGFVGVGLISLGDNLKEYTYGKIKQQSSEYLNQ
tara:strand:+ start:1667 stop:1858 length:192 start_codon:yes stop_codon:yes gene_type:complete